MRSRRWKRNRRICSPSSLTKSCSTTAEKLSVPIIPWSLFTHFPLALAQRVNWAPLSTAIGQMMLFRRSAYERLGGHASVRSEIAEDLAFARQVTRAGGRSRILDGVSRVHCRMYRSWTEVWGGFGKNLFSGFGNTWWLYIFVWIWLGIAFLSPFGMLLWWMAGNSAVSPAIALSSILLAVGHLDHLCPAAARTLCAHSPLPRRFGIGSVAGGPLADPASAGPGDLEGPQGWLTDANRPGYPRCRSRISRPIRQTLHIFVIDLIPR